MPLYLNEEHAQTLLTMTDALECVQQAFRLQGEGRIDLQPRRRVRAPGGTLHVMFAADPETGYLGLKSYTSFGSGVRFHILLYSAQTGELLALMEADQIGRLRTGAACGVASSLLARGDARIAAVIGAGHQAGTQVEALTHCRDLDEVRVFCRSEKRRHDFAAEMSARLGIWVLPAASAEAAVDGAGIVTTITSSAEPVLQSSWLAPGCHLNAAGSNSLLRRELDRETVEKCDLVTVDSLEAVDLEGGDLLPSLQSARLYRSRIVELGQVAAGHHPGRTEAGQITLFKSHGLATQDIALAALLYERALQVKIGCAFPQPAEA